MSKELTKKREAVPVPEPHSRAEVERSLDQLSRLMDGMFRIPGTGWRVGLDALVGLIPGVGDFATTAVSFYILASGVRHGVPKVTLLRMALNVAIDYLLGSVPVLGDLFDMAWKSNQMNVELIRRRAALTSEESSRGRASDWLFLAVIFLVLLALLAGSIALGLWLLALLLGGIGSLF